MEVSDRRSRPPKKAKEEKEVKRWKTESHSESEPESNRLPECRADI